MSVGGVELSGFPRIDGGVGARNHLLVLPTVVCAGMAAAAIARDDAVVIVHQHGCDHVGDDAMQAGRVLVGMAANPNVAGTLLLGLGCETIQGRPLLDELSALDKTVRYLEIQGCGGSANAVESGRMELASLMSDAATVHRSPSSAAGLTVGIAGGRTGRQALLQPLIDRVLASGASTIVALPEGGSDPPASLSGAPVVAYGGRAPSGMSLSHGSASMAEQHAALASSGAQVIVSVCPPGQAPTGSPICPVIAVATDAGMYAALQDDFDVDASGDPDAVADEILARAIAAFNGELTAAERRGAEDFALNRLIRST
jgi:altronate dehydratase large subunit